MKSLFMVGEVSFESKKAAKAYKAVHRGRVTLGVDHWKFGVTNHGRLQAHKRGEPVGNGFPNKRK